MSGDKMARSGHPREVLAHTSSKHTQTRRDIKETGCDDFPTFPNNSPTTRVNVCVPRQKREKPFKLHRITQS